jgi:perosamine synthetase
VTIVPPGPVLSMQRGVGQVLLRGLPDGIKILTRDGRSALCESLKRLGVRQRDRVLVPAYVCQSVVTAIREAGAMPTFYPVSRTLEPDVEELESQLKDVAAVVVIHYFGWAVQGFDAMRIAAATRGVPLIEDCAHALFSCRGSRPLGSQSEAAIFSLRKSLPLPEGGAMVLPGSTSNDLTPPEWTLRECVPLLREMAFKVEDVIGQSLRMKLLARPGILEAAVIRADDVRAHPENRMGPISVWLANRRSQGEIVRTRRSNYAWLRQMLAETEAPVTCFGNELPDGVCPMGLPVLVRNRNEVRRALYRAGIGTRALWDALPAELPASDHGESIYLRDRILLLPIHQDVGERQREKLRRELREAWRLAQ